jgi:hypothetical protein
MAGDTHRETEWCEECMKYAAEMDSGVMTCMPSVTKIKTLMAISIFQDKEDLKDLF